MGKCNVKGEWGNHMNNHMTEFKSFDLINCLIRTMQQFDTNLANRTYFV